MREDAVRNEGPVGGEERSLPYSSTNGVNSLNYGRYQRWAYGQTTGNCRRKTILTYLALMADIRSSCRYEATHAEIAKAVELAPRSVGIYLSELSNLGLITQRPQFDPDGGRRGNEYLLRAPWVTGWPDGETGA